MAAEKSLNQNEKGALAAGAVALILSFFTSYVRVTFDGGKGAGFDVSAGTNAWTSYATIGMLLLIGATAIVGLQVYAADALRKGVPWHLVAVAAAGLGTLLIILRALTVGGGAEGVSVGPGWSGWLLFVAAIALTVFAVQLFRASDETVRGIDDKKA
jgi:hypothetical protein